MTSAVAFVDFHWLSFLLRNSHWTSPSRRVSRGSSSVSVRRASACVSIVSLYQSHERSSRAQYVPRSGSVFAESMTLSQTSFASAARPMRFRTRASCDFEYGEWSFQCLKEKSSSRWRSAGENAFEYHAGSGYEESVKLMNVANSQQPPCAMHRSRSSRTYDAT